MERCRVALYPHKIRCLQCYRDMLGRLIANKCSFSSCFVGSSYLETIRGCTTSVVVMLAYSEVCTSRTSTNAMPLTRTQTEWPAQPTYFDHACCMPNFQKLPVTSGPRWPPAWKGHRCLRAQQGGKPRMGWGQICLGV